MLKTQPPIKAGKGRVSSFTKKVESKATVDWGSNAHHWGSSKPQILKWAEMSQNKPTWAKTVHNCIPQPRKSRTLEAVMNSMYYWRGLRVSLCLLKRLKPRRNPALKLMKMCLCCGGAGKSVFKSYEQPILQHKWTPGKCWLKFCLKGYPPAKRESEYGF
jgi:hypothetical protein